VVGTVLALGGCVHAVVLGPLVADLAPPHLLGRYLSVYRLMVTGGFALGPAVGGVVLALSPNAVWWGGAVLAAAIGAGFLIAGDRIPDGPVAATVADMTPGCALPQPA
jgi:MFS family permease